MKSCNVCGESYSDFIDFCFNDGAVLTIEASALDVPEPSALDAPMPGQGAQPNYPTRSATPVPRSRRRSTRRGLLGRKGPHSEPALPTKPVPVEPTAQDVTPEYTPPAPLPQAHEPTPPVPPQAAPEASEPAAAPPSPPEQPARRVASPPTLIPEMMDEAMFEEPEAAAPAPSPAPPAAPPVSQAVTPVPPPGARTVAPELATSDDLHEIEPTAGPVGWDEDIESTASSQKPVVILVALALLGVVVVGGTLAAGVVGLGLLGSNTEQAQEDPSLPVRTHPEPVEKPTPTPTPTPTPVEADGGDTPPASDQASIDDGATEAGTTDAGDDPANPTQTEGVGNGKPSGTPGGGHPSRKPAPAGGGGSPWGSAANSGGAGGDGGAKPPPPAAKVAVKISSTPKSGATISVAGQSGKTPFSLTLDPGSYPLTAKLKGFEPISKTIQVGPDGASVPLSFKPVAAPAAAAKAGKVMVFFKGRVGDILFIDGKQVGKLPARTEMVQGSHTFAVEGDSGRFQVTKTVKLKDVGTTMLHLDR